MPIGPLSRLQIATVLAAVLVPVLAFMGLAWVQVRLDYGSRIQHYATVTVDRADRIFATAEATLEDMSAHIQPRCTPETYEAMRKVLLQSLYFQEATLISGGKLVCSSNRIYDTPVPILVPDHRVIPASGIHISAPTMTREDTNSIIIHNHLSNDSAFGLMLNSLQISDPLQQLFEDDHVSVRLERNDKAALASSGLPLAAADAGEQRSIASQRYPIRAVAIVSQAWLVREWLNRAPRFGGVGLLVGLSLLAALANRKWRHGAGAEIRRAIQADEFRVFYQPLSDALTGHCVGAESLLRWQHPELGLLPPSQFVPVAERTGMITDLTIWLMRKIVSEMAQVLLDNPGFHISLNLSPGHLLDRNLAAGVRQAFSGIIGLDRIVFEITEHEMIAGHDGAGLEALNAIRAAGARLALDDFGTGYSSLRYLSSLPFDYLKIDKSFIDAIGTESVTAGLVDTITAMARQLGLKTVAEGVETQEQLDYLRRLGVDFIQGWLFAKAMPAWEFKSYVEADKRRQQRVTNLPRPQIVRSK